MLVITDSSEATTGFGIAARHVLPRLSRAGFTIDALAIYRYGKEPVRTGYGTSFPVAPTDSMGFERLPLLLHRNPMAVLLMHELVYCQEWCVRLRKGGWLGPIVGFFPVYGPVVSPLELRGLRLMDRRAALSAYGARIVRGLGFSCTGIHLGVDSGLFRPARDARRRELRRRFGWQDRFVVAYVARNRWNKQQPKLLETAGLLRQAGMSDLLFYLHCVPRPGRPHWVPGMGAVNQESDLMLLSQEYGVEDMVQFPPDLVDQNTGIPVAQLIQHLQAADCVVHVAHAEGFGLPLLEAMACGLPVACTADGAVMQEIVGSAGTYVQPADTLIDATGNRYGNVTAEQWADALRTVRRLCETPSVRRAARRRARRRSLRFTWDSTAEALVRLLQESTAGGSPPWRAG